MSQNLPHPEDSLAHPPASVHWGKLPASQKMLTVSLLMFVFILPITLGFLGQSKDIRQQAAEEDPITIISIPTTPTVSPLTTPVCAEPHCQFGDEYMVCETDQNGCFVNCTCEDPNITPSVTPVVTATVTQGACAAQNRAANRKADFDNSGLVDLTDYTRLSIEFLRNLDTYLADANCDGKVDITDYTRLTIEYLR